MRSHYSSVGLDMLARGQHTDPESYDISGSLTEAPAFTLLSEEPCCANQDCCEDHGHGLSCWACEAPAAVRSETDGHPLCLECAGLSTCDGCGALVPSAVTYETGCCRECDRRALVVSVAGIVTRALATITETHRGHMAAYREAEFRARCRQACSPRPLRDTL